MFLTFYAYYLRIILAELVIISNEVIYMSKQKPPTKPTAQVTSQVSSESGFALPKGKKPKKVYL